MSDIVIGVPCRTEWWRSGWRGWLTALSHRRGHHRCVRGLSGHIGGCVCRCGSHAPVVVFIDPEARP